MDNMLIKRIEHLISYIPQNKENAIHQKELACILCIKPCVVKRLVRQARLKGYEICSCNKGYYLPANDTERREFYNMMHKSAISHFASIKGIKHRLDVSSGQISLSDVLNGTEDKKHGEK